MKRITPEEVVAAYRKTGLRPVRRISAERRFDDGFCVNDEIAPLCGCALVAIATANGARDLDPIQLPESEILNAACEEVFGVRWDDLDGHEYAAGFLGGFDGRARVLWVVVGTPSEQGYDDGRAAWAAVVEAGLVQA